MLTSATRGETLTPNPKSAILNQRVELVGAQSPPTPYILGEGVNYLTLRVQLTFTEFHFETEAKVDFPSACI